ncbi:MAG TPA: hypothetical protein VGD37_39850 [Kofleriaceae bacterium]
MTQAQRSQLAARVVGVYWLMLLGGLVLFTVARIDDTTVVVPLWVGAIGGTLLGQYLALHDLRSWLAAVIIAAAALYCEPLLPLGNATAQLWQAFLPAALCGFWSLGDRAGLAATWFPAVLWMLAILDGNDARLAPDGPAAVLLGGFAVLFVWFLHARESRRIGLWRSVAAEPLAPAQPIEVLREPPGRQLARVAWGVSTGAITVAITVWLVPPLWQTEELVGPAVQIDGAPAGCVPCCPLHPTARTQTARIKEYLGLGLGHDAHPTAPLDELACRACDGAAAVITVPGIAADGEPAIAVASAAGTGDVASPGARDLARTDRGSSIGTPLAEPDAVAPATAAWTDPGSLDLAGGSPAPPAVPGSLSWTDPGAPIETTASDLPPISAAPEPPLPPQIAPPRPPAPPPSTTTAAPAPISPPAAAPQPPQPPSRGGTGPPGAPHRTATDTLGTSVLRWLALILGGAVVLHGVRLALRPLRRLVHLRHLRRPFWSETLDQRVSNAWQLALIGLRDAGWRPGATEAPAQLARRAGVVGLDRCAAILERARHGVGLDAGDLADMQASADLAYGAARTGAGRFARAVGWLRWPLT